MVETATASGTGTLYSTNDLDGTDPMYIGTVADNGAWLIKKFSESAGTIRYCVGDSDYATAWAGRLLLTYVSFDEL